MRRWAPVMNNILVIGSTGNVGRPLVEELARMGERVRAARRNPSILKTMAAVESVRFDYADPGTFGPAIGGRTAFS